MKRLSRTAKKFQARIAGIMRIARIAGVVVLAATAAPATAIDEDALFALSQTGAVDQTAAVGTTAADSEAALFDESLFDAESALFASFDAGIPTAGEEAKTEYLVGGTVAVQANGTFLPESKSALGSSDAVGKIFAKVSIPDSGSLYVSWSVTQAFFRSWTGEGSAPAQLTAPETPVFTLSEIHYSFDFSKKLFFRLGTQLTGWGPPGKWSPVDFVNQEKEDTAALVDKRTGRRALRLHIPFARGNLYAIADFSPLFANTSEQFEVLNTNGGVRIDGTFAGFEFGLSAYGGRTAQARFGADFSGRLAGATVYGEAAWAPEYDSYESTLLASLGGTRSFGSVRKISISAEGFFNSPGMDLSGTGFPAFTSFPAERQASLYQGKWYAWASLASDGFFPDLVNPTLSGTINLSDPSLQAKLAIACAIPGTLPFTVSATWNRGEDNTEFTRYYGNNSISVSLSTRMEF